MPTHFTRRIAAQSVLVSALAITSLSLVFCGLVAANPPLSPADQTLRRQLSHNDIAGALKTALTMPRKDDAYALIAEHQIGIKDFAGARKTIRHITVGTRSHADAGLIQHSSALTVLARGLYAAGRKGEARVALNAAMSDAGKIPTIFAEMGEGFGPSAGERWIDIADVQLSVSDRHGASRSLDKAESFAAGSHLGYDGSDVLARIEKGRIALGQTAAAKRAHREGKFVEANSITDIAVKAEALIDVDATESNAAGVIETAKQQGRVENPVTLLCHGVITINRIHGNPKSRKRLLDEARKISARTKDPKFKKMEQDIIAKAAGGATEY